MQQMTYTEQTASAVPQSGTLVSPLSHSEAMTMCAEELRRFLALIESLAGDDWDRQTACSLWTVRDVVAHQAAHVSSLTSLRNFLSQANPAMLRPYRKKGMSVLDAMNQAQVDLRRGYTPTELIAEIRNAVTPSLEGRDRIPAFLRALTLPLPGFDQPRPLGYLFDLVYTRDMWMHRIDICLAAGREMPLDAVYDGRMVALIVRDLAEKSKRGLHGRSAVLELTGVAGGSYQIGQNPTPEAVIELDTLLFCILTSGREKAANLLTNSRAAIRGDVAFGRAVLDFSENRVLY